jgi:hypothetical protein
MARFEDEREGEFAAGRVPGRFYVSRRFGGEGPVQRFAYEVRDGTSDEVLFESEDGWELVLNETATRQQLKAIFFESTRGVAQLAFQKFNRSGKPIHNHKKLLLSMQEVHDLQRFLDKIRVADLHGEEGVRFSEGGIQQLLEGVQLPADVLRERIDDVAEFLQSDLSAPEVVALARRRAKLAEARRMLDENLTEPEWQAWFEEEQWILGFGAAPQFLHCVGDKLEQVLAGFDMTSAGTRTDGVLRTAARLGSLVLVEIKRPDTPLLKRFEYRSDTWVPDKDVVGGVAQLHNAVDAARRTFGERFSPVDESGFTTDVVVELCRPRTVLVAGRLSSLCNESGQPHHAKFRSFESYRRSLQDPEIVTFDEVLARAEAAVMLAEPPAP